jgi:hypothetical protein
VTFSSTFDWDVTTETLVPDSMVTASTGLGPFVLSFITVHFANWLDPLHNLLQFIPSDHALPVYFDTVGTFSGVSLELLNSSGGFYFPGNLSATPTTGSVVITGPTVATPEPSTWLLMLAGIAALGGAFVTKLPERRVV